MFSSPILFFVSCSQYILVEKYLYQHMKKKILQRLNIHQLTSQVRLAFLSPYFFFFFFSLSADFELWCVLNCQPKYIQWEALTILLVLLSSLGWLQPRSRLVTVDHTAVCMFYIKYQIHQNTFVFRNFTLLYMFYIVPPFCKTFSHIAS